MDGQAQIAPANLPVELPQASLQTALYTALALIAFAANSILCRLALSSADADPASFTAIRLASGATVLVLLTRGRGKIPDQRIGGNWQSAMWLFLYAVMFSFAYLRLTTGMGALILFAAVQLTMIGAAMRSGERPKPFQLFGVVTAFAGLAYLVFPGLSAPAPSSAALMALAGISWGMYSLRGRNQGDPLTTTSGNFLRALPFAIIFSALAIGGAKISRAGILCAVLSGALASGLGYAVWYAALRRLTALRAATVQLAVPVITALAGVAFLSEKLTLRLTVSAAAILAGITITLRTRAGGR